MSRPVILDSKGLRQPNPAHDLSILRPYRGPGHRFAGEPGGRFHPPPPAVPRLRKRFTTYERIDEVPYMVIKKDGRREKFDRQKVLNGLLKACEKRPISMVKLSDLVNQVEARVTESPDREITTTEIGEYLMDSLRASTR